MKDNLTLLKFPEVKDDLNKYRIEQALSSLLNAECEYEAADQILVGLYDFLSGLTDTELMLHDITKLRGSLEEYYEQF